MIVKNVAEFAIFLSESLKKPYLSKVFFKCQVKSVANFHSLVDFQRGGTDRLFNRSISRDNSRQQNLPMSAYHHFKFFVHSKGHFLQLQFEIL